MDDIGGGGAENVAEVVLRNNHCRIIIVIMLFESNQRASGADVKILVAVDNEERADYPAKAEEPT